MTCTCNKPFQTLELELEPCVYVHTHEDCADVTVHELCAENVRATDGCVYKLVMSAQFSLAATCGMSDSEIG